MGEYDSVIELAERLIRKKGRAIVLRRTVKTPPDPSKPWTVDTQNFNYNRIGVFINFEEKQIDGTLIHQEDQRLLFSAKNLLIIPSVEDVVIDETAEWKIIWIRPLKPGMQTIIYEAQVRR